MKRHKNNYTSIVNSWNIGIGLTLSVAAFFLGKSKFVVLYQENIYHFFSTLSLSIIALFQFFIYYIQTGREMTLLHNYIDADSIPRLKGKVYFTILGLAIVFGLLIAFSDDILIYCSVLLTFNFLDSMGEIQISAYTSDRISIELHKTKSKKDKNTFEALKEYFNYRNIFTIQFLSYTVNWIALVFAILFNFNHLELFRMIATTIIILNMIIGEIILHSRRFKRDKKLDDNE